jgi:hypothetical protein
LTANNSFKPTPFRRGLIQALAGNRSAPVVQHLDSVNHAVLAEVACVPSASQAGVHFHHNSLGWALTLTPQPAMLAANSVRLGQLVVANVTESSNHFALLPESRLTNRSSRARFAVSWEPARAGGPA